MVKSKEIVSPLQDILLNPRRNDISFSFRKGICKNVVDPERFATLPRKDKLHLLRTYPPIVLEPDEYNNYHIIANHPAYKAIRWDASLPGLFQEISKSSVRAHLKSIGVEDDKIDHKMIKDKIDELVQDLARLDPLTSDHINACIDAITAPKESSPAKISRDEAISAGQVCPVHQDGSSKHALLGPLNEEPIDPGAKIKYYLVSCFDSHQFKRVPKNATVEYLRHKHYRCHFYAVLNEHEFSLFKHGKFPTHLWMVEQKGQLCECGGQLFLRTIHHRDRIEKIIICIYNCHSNLKLCNYEEDIKTWQPRLNF